MSDYGPFVTEILLACALWLLASIAAAVLFRRIPKGPTDEELEKAIKRRGRADD